MHHHSQQDTALLNANKEDHNLNKFNFKKFNKINFSIQLFKFKMNLNLVLL